MNWNFTDTAWLMTPDDLLREAGRQFAMAEAVGRSHYQAPLWERGGWFLLLVRADVSGVSGMRDQTVSPSGIDTSPTEAGKGD